MPSVEVPMSNPSKRKPVAARIAKQIWQATEAASIKLASAERYCTYTPPTKEFKQEMLRQYEQIISSALGNSGRTA